MTGRAGWGVLAAAVLAGCATKGSVRLVETQVAVLRAETARRDSARAAELARIIRLQQATIDSLATARQTLRTVDARLGNELLDIQRQLLAIQELTGQSQARLSRLQAQLDTRAAAAEVAAPAPAPAPVAGVPADTGRKRDSAAAVAPPPAASAEQMYEGALQQFRRGSIIIARRAFLEFLDTYSDHPLAPDAVYYVGETYDPPAPDSAVMRFQEVLTRFPQSRRAPSAAYKIGLIAERRGDAATARAAYQRVIAQYPRSDEADLARGRLESLKP
jgi:tol-pal system protein YbgF